MDKFRFMSYIICLFLIFSNIMAVPKYKMAGGVHILADFSECCVPDNVTKLEAILRAAARAAGSHDLEFTAHKFEPHGISAILILAESHISIHSWPEKQCAAVDVYTCGKAKPKKAIDYLKKAFNAGKVKIKKVKRGKND